MGFAVEFEELGCFDQRANNSSPCIIGTPNSKRSTRDVPLVDSALIADLRRYKMSHPRSGDLEALLWPGRKVGGVAEIDYDRVLDVGSFRRNYFRPALRVLGLKEMRVLDLRHTAASVWLAAGFEPWEVSRWLGHASITTTDTIYAHLYPSDYTRHMARFAAFRESGTA